MAWFSCSFTLMTRSWLQESVEGYDRGGTTEEWRHEVHLLLLLGGSALFFCACGLYSFKRVLLFSQNLPKIGSCHDAGIFVYRKEKRLRKSIDKKFREDLAKRAAYIMRRSMLRRYFRFLQVFLRIPDGFHNLHQSLEINFLRTFRLPIWGNKMSYLNPSWSWWVVSRWECQEGVDARIQARAFLRQILILLLKKSAFRAFVALRDAARKRAHDRKYIK
jgi:hypothetical protein